MITTSRRISMGPYELWYDQAHLDKNKSEIKIDSILKSKYTGIVTNLEELPKLSKMIKKGMKYIITVNDRESYNKLNHLITSELKDKSDSIIVKTQNSGLLNSITTEKYGKCLKVHVEDHKSLISSIDSAKSIDYLCISFKDPTNIPLELVLAKLQASGIKIIKEIGDQNMLSDAKSVFGVMEVGVDGILYSPQKRKIFELVNSYINEMSLEKLDIQTATVIQSEFVGMGHRSCLDLTTLFSESEGILVGSTSSGGLLCCSEVFHLPYMEKRPFRVNAGSVHSYVFNCGDTTNYMTELCSGSSIMVVDQSGKTRRSTVGRVKTEIRPLRLIEVEFENKERANIIMQDDWHVRVFNDEGNPANITHLKKGDKVLGYYTKPGRHVGIRIEEDIREK